MKDYQDMLEITLYGSYFPQTERKLLLKMKDFLKENGFVKTRLVTDFHLSLTPLEQSKYCLEQSHANFLIFTKGKRFGLVRELAHIVESPKMKKKINHCVIFDKIIRGRSSIPDLSKSDTNFLLLVNDFQNKKELKEGLLAKANWYLGLYYQKFSSMYK